MSHEATLTDGVISSYLKSVTATDGVPFSLVVPQDAGSQTLALIAAGSKQLEGQQFEIVVLVSSAQTDEPQIQTQGRLETPLGALEVNQQIGKTLEKKLPGARALKFSKNETSKLADEKFQVLASFVKFLLPDARVLPVLIPQNDHNTGLELGKLLAEITKDQQAVLVAQSDLDETLLTALEFNQPETFSEKAAAISRKQGDEREKEGLTPAPSAAALAFARAYGGNTVSVLEQFARRDFRHAAVMLWDYQPPELSEDQKSRLMTLAAQAIEKYVTSGVIPQAHNNDPVFNRKTGVFVTLRIRGMLRGCIGHMTAEEPLLQAVQEMAVAAATADPRFPPLSRAEIEQISIKIAILSPLQRISIPQIEVGKHGLLIAYGGRRGVLLPEVAAERGWDRETYLENLCYKAGLPADTWRKNPTLYAFTSVVFGNE